MATLTPAYGRDYKSKRAVMEDFLGEKDFIFHDPTSKWNGKPCSIHDFKKGETVNIRYGQLRKVMVLEISDIQNS